MSEDRIHEQAADVLKFWFDEAGEERWWKKDEDFDAEIRERFGVLRNDVFSTQATGWRDDPQTLLAAVILLDQFSRNLFRGDAEAFAADPLACELTREAIAKGWPEKMDPDHRFFLFMPLMHSEDMADQKDSVRLFDAMADDGHDRFAHLHYDQIERFGRFPGRNEALGRTSTEEERGALADGAAF
ncbi:DUF924 family protein [Sphingomicrobium sp. XHP0239]|uniref:DUF924 family protein n=1 Tax=Sphingomicrobium maritimum TaxID=3133972 RepID=UPI0031CC7810